MRYFYITVILILVAVQTNAQHEDSLKLQIAKLKELASASQGNEKLQWLDSLSKVTRTSANYNYDSIAKATIGHALRLDSLIYASIQVMEHIYYKNNIIGKPSEGIPVYRDFVKRKGTYDNKAWMAKIFIEVGDSHYFSGNRDSALVYYDKAIEYASNGGEEITIGFAKLYKGGLYSDIGDFTKSSQLLQESIPIFSKYKDTTNLISARSLLSILYSQNNFFEEAQKERIGALALSVKTKDYGKIASISYNQAADYDKNNQQKERIASLLKAVEYGNKSKFKNFYEGPFYAALAKAYLQNDSIKKAQDYLLLLEKNPDNTTGRNRSAYLDALKHLALYNKDYDKAIKFGREQLDINTSRNLFEEMMNDHKFLSTTYEKTNIPEKAYSHYKRYTTIKDSLQDIKKINGLSYYQTLYETEKRDQQIQAQNANIDLLKEKNKVRNQWFIIGGILVTLMFLVFYLRSRYKQKLQRRIAIEQLRTKISADLHDDVGSVLTGLAMQTDLIERKVPQEHKKQLQKVSSLSRAAMLQMRDAVWSMDARKDNWGALIDRINEFASENLSSKNINYTLESTGIQVDRELPGAIRQNLYLIAKEAIANILKHSTASRVTIELQASKNWISLVIEDNGVVTTNGRSPTGLGLSNMKKRAAQLDGSVGFDHTNGFLVTIEIPYNL